MVKIKANAKINLTLDILGRRADGYHEVEMVMQSVGLFDEISLKRTEKGISLAMDTAELAADRTNLAWRAAELFFQETGQSGGVEIFIKKSIPVAAGLAGGSADAAGVLRGMNELFGTGLSQAALCRLGERLGSDVPFCIVGGTMLATGRGEVLRELPAMPECYVVLAKPPVAVSTAWAYRRYDECGSAVRPDNRAVEAALAKGNLKAIGSLLCNVLEAVTSAEYKEISAYEQLMLASGAMAVRMSGSGPTVFALTDSREKAEKIAEAVRRSADAEAVCAVTISGRN